jgi:hypothetical protein
MAKYGKEQYIRKTYEPTVLAYLAGIVDGEGSISAGSYSASSIGTRQHTTYLSVTNTDKSLIDWLVFHFGSKAHPFTSKQLSKNSRKPAWRWQVSGDRLLHICEEILPYIVAKKKQVEIMIKLRETYTKRTYEVGQRGPKISQEIIDLRDSYVRELRACHIRTSSIKHF